MSEDRQESDRTWVHVSRKEISHLRNENRELRAEVDRLRVAERLADAYVDWLAARESGSFSYSDILGKWGSVSQFADAWRKVRTE